MNLGRRSIRTQDLARAINAPRRDRSPLQGEIRAVYQRQPDGPWRFMVGRCVLGTGPVRERTETYSGSIFICKALPALPVKSFIERLTGDGFTLSKGLPPLKMTVTNPSWTEQIVPSNATERCVPRRLFSARIVDDAYFQETQLAAYGMPYHASSAAYTKGFLGLTQFSVAGRMRKLCLVGQINGEEPIRLMKGECATIDVEEVMNIELWLLSKEGP